MLLVTNSLASKRTFSKQSAGKYPLSSATDLYTSVREPASGKTFSCIFLSVFAAKVLPDSLGLLLDSDNSTGGSP